MRFFLVLALVAAVSARPNDLIRPVVSLINSQGPNFASEDSIADASDLTKPVVETVENSVGPNFESESSIDASDLTKPVVADTSDLTKPVVVDQSGLTRPVIVDGSDLTKPVIVDSETGLVDISDLVKPAIEHAQAYNLPLVQIIVNVESSQSSSVVSPVAVLPEVESEAIAVERPVPGISVDSLLRPNIVVEETEEILNSFDGDSLRPATDIIR